MRHVAAHYTWRRVAQDMIRTYESALGTVRTVSTASALTL
jgi:hypothetical protein